MKNSKINMKNSKKPLLKFAIPSIIGIIIFMIPVKFDGNWTILVKILADYIGKLIGPYLPILCTLIISISAVMSIMGSLLNVKFVKNNKLLNDTFCVSLGWLILRLLGFIVVWLVVLKDRLNLNPFFKMIVDDSSATFILNDLLTSLVIIFLIASMLLPLLLDFGLLEFIGAIFTKFMRPVFLIPGRAAVDCITSWIGDGTLGVMLTSNQYESGFYSAKEAAIIATNFSAVSITFSLIVLSQVDMVDYFGVYYLLVCFVGLLCAIIVPRIPPLSLKKDEYFVDNPAAHDSEINYSSSFEYGIDLALKRAESHKGLGEFLKNGIKNAFGMWFSVIPIVMIIGTISLVLANNTQIFEILGKPFLPLLNVLKIPESLAASKTMIVGFSDMFTPSIIAANTITSQMTKFIVATISVTQLIYLSEVGGLILASRIPVNLFELFVIFIERTIISLLVVAPIAHLIFR